MGLSIRDFEQVVFCNDEKTGLEAIIAIHSTALGPAVGGCRMWDYANSQEALTDALRLSKGMTYKAAVSGLQWGGGKSVIVGGPAKKTPELLKKFGEFVERLGGHYVTAKDVGIGSEDLKQIKSVTKNVLGIEGEKNSSGDPSPATAHGVYHGMKSAAKHGLGSDSLNGVTVAMQGLGAVSFGMLSYLHKEGAKIIATDIDPAKIEKAKAEFGITAVGVAEIYDVQCDIFSPCALGASINAKTLPRIKAKVIAGAANNQLATDDIGLEVMKRGLIYAPDYAINAGGLMNIYHESMVDGGYDHDRAFSHIAKIGQTIDLILTRAASEKLPSSVVADQIAEERVTAARIARG
jgi:leucine dehydrogenase